MSARYVQEAAPPVAGEPAPAVVVADAPPSPQRSSLLALPLELLVRLLLLVPDTAGELLRLCSVSAEFRSALGTPSAQNRGGLAWRKLFDRLDPGAVLLAPGAGRSCAGYIEHAERFSGAGGQQPGLLKLAHALASNACAACGSVTRFIAWKEHGPEGLQRCCSGCPLPGDSDGDDSDLSESSESTEERSEATLINELLFQSDPVVTIDACVLPRDEALTRLQIAVHDAVDGDTIALNGAFKYYGDTESPLGTFTGAMGSAIRLLGLSRRESPSEETATSALSHLVTEPDTSIYVENNCIELYAPGAMLENLSLSSGGNEDDDEFGYDGPDAFAGVYAIPDQYSFDTSPGAPTFIFKRCLLRGDSGTSLVMGSGTRCALLQSVFGDTEFYHVHAEPGTVLRLSGCRLPATELGGLLSLAGKQGEDDGRAVAASNDVSGVDRLFEGSAPPPDGAAATLLLV